MILLLCSLAFADEVHAIEEGTTATVEGPAVWMGAAKFRQYVADSRNLPVCQEGLDKAIAEGMEANNRTLEAWRLAKEQFASDEVLIDEQVQTIADLGAKLDDAVAKNNGLRQQRNVAWGIAGGFLAASTAAVVLTLSN